jgi:hypothetical protein
MRLIRYQRTWKGPRTPIRFYDASSGSGGETTR